MVRESNFAFIDINSEVEGDIAYCPNCEQVGLQIKLTDVIIGINEIPKEDDNNWCQCPRCGKKQPLYNIEREGQYSFPFDHVENPFDSGSQFAGIGKRKKHNRLNDYKDKSDI